MKIRVRKDGATEILDKNLGTITVIEDEFHNMMEHFYESKTKAVPKKRNAWNLKPLHTHTWEAGKQDILEDIGRAKEIFETPRGDSLSSSNILYGKNAELRIRSTKTNYIRSMGISELVSCFQDGKRIGIINSKEVFIQDMIVSTNEFGFITYHFYLTNGRKIKRTVDETAQVCQEKKLSPIPS